MINYKLEYRKKGYYDKLSHNSKDYDSEKLINDVNTGFRGLMKYIVENDEPSMLIDLYQLANSLSHQYFKSYSIYIDGDVLSPLKSIIMNYPSLLTANYLSMLLINLMEMNFDVFHMIFEMRIIHCIVQVVKNHEFTIDMEYFFKLIVQIVKKSSFLQQDVIFELFSVSDLLKICSSPNFICSYSYFLCIMYYISNNTEINIIKQVLSICEYYLSYPNMDDQVVVHCFFLLDKISSSKLLDYETWNSTLLPEILNSCMFSSKRSITLLSVKIVGNLALFGVHCGSIMIKKIIQKICENNDSDITLQYLWLLGCISNCITVAETLIDLSFDTVLLSLYNDSPFSHKKEMIVIFDLIIRKKLEAHEFDTNFYLILELICQEVQNCNHVNTFFSVEIIYTIVSTQNSLQNSALLIKKYISPSLLNQWTADESISSDLLYQIQFIIDQITPILTIN